MKTTIKGKRYNSDSCEELASHDHRNNGNYSGTSTLMLAGDGAYLVWLDTNGQDCYLSDNFGKCEDVPDFIDWCDLTDDEATRLAELGLIEIID